MHKTFLHDSLIFAPNHHKYDGSFKKINVDVTIFGASAFFVIVWTALFLFAILPSVCAVLGRVLHLAINAAHAYFASEHPRFAIVALHDKLAILVNIGGGAVPDGAVG